MSKRTWQWMGVLAAAALAGACADESGITAPPYERTPADVVELTVQPGNVVLRQGEAVQLQAEMTGRDGTPLGGLREPILWSSSRPEVAAVSATGVLLALAPGKAVVTAGCGTYCAFAGVTVLPPGDIDPPGDTARAAR